MKTDSKKKGIRLLLFLALILALSCCSEPQKSSIISCDERCDSLSYRYRDGKLSGIYTFYQGRPEGTFVLFYKGDTLWGYDKYYGPYLKRTNEVNKEIVQVQLQILRKGKYETRDRVFYENGKLQRERGSFFEVVNDEKVGMTSFNIHLRFPHDSIYLQTKNRDVIAKIDSASSQLKVETGMLRNRKDLQLSVFSDLGKLPSGGRKIMSVSYPLIPEMLDEDFIKPEFDW